METQNIKNFKIKKFTKAFSKIRYTLSVDLISQTFTIRRTKDRYFVNEQDYDLPESYDDFTSLLNKLPLKNSGDDYSATDVDVWYKATYYDSNDKKHEVWFVSKEESSIWFSIINWLKNTYSWVEDVPEF